MSQWGSAKARKVFAALMGLAGRSSARLAARTESCRAPAGQMSSLHFTFIPAAIVCGGVAKPAT